MSRATQDTDHCTLTYIRGYHPLWRNFPDASADLCTTYICPTTPTMPKQCWFGLFPVRSPLLRESIFLSFPPATEMFQFAGLATHAYGFSMCQFGNPGIKARLSTPPGFSQTSTPFKAS